MRIMVYDNNELVSVETDTVQTDCQLPQPMANALEVGACKSSD